MQGIRSLIGIPYEKKNCWALAIKFYKDLFDIEISHVYSGDAPETKEETEMLIRANRGRFREVALPKFGDLIVMKMFGVECHIAIYLRDREMLHTSKRVGSHIAKVDRWKNQIVGYYRVIEE